MAGSVTLQSDKLFGENREVVITCVGDASDGSVPETNLIGLAGYVYGSIAGWGLWLVEPVPGTTPPTADSNVYLETEDGTDLLAGLGAGALDAANPNGIWPQIPVVPIGSELNLVVDGQSVNSATYTIKLHLVR